MRAGSRVLKSTKNCPIATADSAGLSLVHLIQAYANLDNSYPNLQLKINQLLKLTIKQLLQQLLHQYFHCYATQFSASILFKKSSSLL